MAAEKTYLRSVAAIAFFIESNAKFSAELFNDVGAVDPSIGVDVPVVDDADFLAAFSANRFCLDAETGAMIEIDGETQNLS